MFKNMKKGVGKNWQFLIYKVRIHKSIQNRNYQRKSQKDSWLEWSVVLFKSQEFRWKMSRVAHGQ